MSSSPTANQSAYARRAKVFKMVVISFFVVYSLVTLFPFYSLFIRTFVRPEEAADLQLWIPPTQEVSPNAEIGNLAVFYNLDLAKVKEDLGIPATEYIPARMNLEEFAEEYDIPLDQVKSYFKKFYRFNGWITLYSKGDVLPAIGRTLLVTAGGLFGVHALSICTGYGLARLERKDQMFIYNLYLINPLIPPMLVLLPQFLIVQSLVKLLPESARSAGQLIALILIYSKGGALPSMIYTTAISAIPKPLRDSALIDGANPLQYFLHIVLPLLKVPIATVTVIMLPWLWNDFLRPYVYLSSSNTTLLPLIQQYTGQYTTNFQVTYTGVFISIIPLLVVYILFRQWFIRGAMAGALKG